MTLRQRPGVVYSKGGAPSKVQEGLDPGVCNNHIADLHILMHRQALVEFNAIWQGNGTVQDLLIRLDKLAGRMVEAPNGYIMRVHFVEALCEPLKQEVLR